MNARNRAAALAAAAFALSGAAQAMTTPALLDPAAIAGTWTLSRDGGPRCTLVLKTDPAPGGRGYALELGSCAQVEGISAATRWRVSNDGIGLSAARSTVIFLSRQGPDLFRTSGQSSLDVGGQWTLTRD